jgi:GT2 family glycosyltransferase
MPIPPRHHRRQLSVAVVLYNNGNVVFQLLDSMLGHLDLSGVTVYIIDNGSTDGAAERIELDYPEFVVLRNPGNPGFGAGHNQVLGLMDSDYHLVLNPDVVFTADALTPMLDYMDAHPEVAIVTPRILNNDGSEQVLPKMRPHLRYLLARRQLLPQQVSQRLCAEYTLADDEIGQPTAIDCATGSCLIIRTAIYRQLQGFDQRFFMYFEDYDLSLRAAEYGKVMFFPGTSVIHGYTRAGARRPKAFLQQVRSMLRFFLKHGW